MLSTLYCQRCWSVETLIALIFLLQQARPRFNQFDQVDSHCYKLLTCANCVSAQRLVTSMACSYVELRVLVVSWQHDCQVTGLDIAESESNNNILWTTVIQVHILQKILTGSNIGMLHVKLHYAGSKE